MWGMLYFPRRKIANFAGYIGEFEFVDDHRGGKIVVELNGRSATQSCSNTACRCTLVAEMWSCITVRIPFSGSSHHGIAPSTFLPALTFFRTCSAGSTSAA